MNRQLEETLVEALDLLEQGTPVAEIMSRFPEMAGELRPYLLTAVELDRLAQPASTAAEQASKGELLRYANSLKSERGRSPVVWLRQVLVSTAAIIFLLIACGTVIGAVSAGAVPGDVLYGSKLFLEEMRLNYSADPDAAATMLEEFRRERLSEVETLLNTGRVEAVQFSGRVEALSQDRWVVAGIPVAISPATIIHEDVEIGFMVQVIGRTSGGFVRAEEIDVYGAQPPKPDRVDPLPTTEPSPTPTTNPFNTPQQPDVAQPDGGPDSALQTPEPSPQATPADDLSDDESIEHSNSEEEPSASQGQEDEPASDDSDSNREDGGRPDDAEEGSDESGSGHDAESGDADSDEDNSDAQGSGDESESHDDGGDSGDDHESDRETSGDGEQSDDDEAARQEDSSP